MNAVIISVGDELLTGACADTNSVWLSQRLTTLGLTVVRHVTVGDDLPALTEVLANAAPVIIVTGGLGPTPDDLTRQAMAATLHQSLEEDAQALATIEAYFARRERKMSDADRVQALIPHGCTAITNPLGTAPGICCRCDDRKLYALPGVPREMRAMFEASVVPDLDCAASMETMHNPGSGPGNACSVALRCYGLGEARMGEMLSDLMQRGRNPSVGTTACDTIITVRVLARGENEADARRLLEVDEAEIRRRLGAAVFGEGETTLEEAVGRLFLERRWTLATAESCTGGLLAKRLTDIPGSSGYFLRGYITYANEAKCSVLGVSEDLIATQGAVSEPVARAMARGARRLSGSDLAVSITGVAGPDGASPPDKPVGLVYLGLDHSDGTEARRLLFGDTLTRDEVRDRSCKAALNFVRRRLIEAKTTRAE